MGAPSASCADDGASPAAVATAAKDAEPATTKDPQIALDDLELLLAPMTKEETETEAKGWYALLRAKEREITVAELDVRRKNREIAQLEKQKTAAADLASESHGKSKPPHPTRTRRRPPSTSRKRRKIWPRRSRPQARKPQRRRRRPRRPPPLWPSKPRRPLRRPPRLIPRRLRRAQRSRRRRATRTSCRKRPNPRRRNPRARRHRKGREGGRGDREGSRRRGPNQNAG